MKKLLTIFSAVVLVFLTSCKEVEPVFTLTDQTISVPAAGAEQTVTFQTNQDWNAISSANWLSVSPTSGLSTDDGNVTLEIKVAANSSFDTRSAKITISAGSFSAVITVNQEALERVFTLKDQTISAPIAGVEQAVTFQTNQEWKAVSDADWVSVSPASGVGSDANVSLTVKVAQTDSFDTRSAKVTVSAGSFSAVITVNQEALEAYLNLISDSSVNVSEKGENVTVKIETNASWVASADSDWISIAEANGQGNASIVAKVSSNDKTSARGGKVTVKVGKISKEITINQEAGKNKNESFDPLPGINW